MTDETDAIEPSSGARQDLRVLAWGVLACAGFTLLIAGLGGRLERIPHLPDTGAAWYFWKLPVPTVAGRVSAWGLYLAHQVASWGLILYAQRRVRTYSTRLRTFHYVSFGVTAAFVVAHLVQTHLWYDGLAQDVSVFSSQGSVIVLLVWVLLMENARRGLVFGLRAPIGRRVVDAARRYHGYYFSWAVVYTFWFHPAERTSGHLIGFFYTFLLLLQSCLIFTPAHANRWWTFTLEAGVLAHGTLVALMQAGPSGFWPMFFFGFLGILVITQVHGLGLPAWARVGSSAAYLGLIAWVYGGFRGWPRVGEVLRIPIVDYVLVFVLAGLIAGALAVSRRIGRRARTS